MEGKGSVLKRKGGKRTWGWGIERRKRARPPWWCRVWWDMGMVSGRLSTFTTVQNGNMVLKELFWGVDG